MEIILGMFFLALSNTDIEFTEREKSTWRYYTVTKALLTTSHIELIDKREFSKAALDKNTEIFVMNITALEIPTALPIYPSRTS